MLLAEQARTAGQFARDGVLDLRIPIALGAQDVDLRLRVGPPPPESSDDEAVPTPQRVQLDLTLDGLGRIQVRLESRAGTLRAELITAQPGTADVIEIGLADLSAALGAAGFREVLARVAIDPVRLAAGDAPLPLPPDGSILSTEA